MKQIIKSAIIAIAFTSGTVMFTSCDKVVEDTVDGLFKPLNDAAEEYAKERKQQNMDNLFNWRIGNDTDQEAIDKYGLDNCFQVTELNSAFWASSQAPDVNPAIDINNLRMVRCLTHSYNSIAICGLICDKSIASDVAWIFRQLYDANYQIKNVTTAEHICKENLTGMHYTYGYFFDINNPESATELERQGLSVTINAGKPLASDDLAVKLFKEKGFKWGGDEPEGDPNCFSK